MKYAIVVFFFFTISFFVSAQSITWEKQFHFDKYCFAWNSIETQDSGYFIPAYFGNDSAEVCWLVKLDKHGDIEWRKMIGSKVNAESLIEKKPGLYSLIDYDSAYNSATKKWSYIYDMIDVKENGDTTRVKKQNISDDRYFIYNLLSLNNGNYIAEGNLGNEMLIQKYDGKDQVVWSDTFNTSTCIGGSVMLKTHDHKIVIGGEAGGCAYDNQFSFLMVLDTNGKKVNYVQFPYVSDSSEQINYIAQLSNSNIMVESTSGGNKVLYFTLADSVGNIIRKWEIEAMIPNVGPALINIVGGFVPDGDSILVACRIGIDVGPLNLIKFDTGMNQIWIKNYDDTFEYGNYTGIIRTSDKGLFLAGSRVWYGGTSSLEDSSDLLAIKLDGQGNLAKADYAGIHNATQKNSFFVYPNPATDNLYISGQINNINIGLEIFDSRGIKVINEPYLNPGTQKIDVSSLGKGLYMYRLYNGEGPCGDGKFIKE